MLSESQLQHKTVNLLFQLVIVNKKLTILWESPSRSWSPAYILKMQRMWLLAISEMMFFLSWLVP